MRGVSLPNIIMNLQMPLNYFMAITRKYMNFTVNFKFLILKIVNAMSTCNTPVFRYNNLQEDVQIEVCYNNVIGLKNSILLKVYSKLDPIVRDFSKIIKLWGKVHKVTGKKGMMLYALMLMVIFNFQKRNFIPNI